MVKLDWYDHWYKKLLLIPLILLAIAIIYLAIFYNQNGDFINKDSSLAGGTTITLTGNYSLTQVETALKDKFADVSIRKITDLTSNEQIALIIDSSASPDTLVPEIELVIGEKLTEKNSSIEFSGPSLGASFYKQLIIALVISFILMAIVIFVLFKTAVPSLAVILAAFSDIVIPLAILDFFGVKISAAGIAAFLMLIGYSVDTDILLTTRVLKKREGTVNERIFGAFKTGILMTITALIAVLPAFFVSGLPDTFKQIFLILTLGLGADILNTWLLNTGIIKWYAVRKGL